jgi:hypothetical protein
MSSKILYPVDEIQEECAICGGPLYGIPRDLTRTYPNLVCEECDQKAVNEDGSTPKWGAEYREALKKKSDNPESVTVPTDSGENPVFIEGRKCWRRYKFGGFITRLDQYDCDSISEFKKKHRPE